MFKLFGNDDNTDNDGCTASGWTVRPASTRPTGGRTDQRCPAGDHKVTTTVVRGGAVRIGWHRR